MNADESVSQDDVANLLAPVLGLEKSREIVTSCACTLGFARAPLTASNVITLFDRLAHEDGIAGVAARVAIARGDAERLAARVTVKTFESKLAGAESRADFSVDTVAPSSARVRAPRIDILPLLIPSLGMAKAREALEVAAARTGVDHAAGLSRHGALLILEDMMKVDGVVGVVACFAKARFLLQRSE